jgi:hypothetical protein
LEKEGYRPSSHSNAVLREYGGLVVHQSGPGEEVARASFAITPLSGSGEFEYVQTFAHALSTSLFPVGEAEDGAAFLLVADDGRVVVIQGNGWVIGDSFEAGLETLILGRRGVLFVPR